MKAIALFLLLFLCCCLNISAQNLTIDTSFGVSGIATNNIGATGQTLSSIAIQPDGKIIGIGGLGYVDEAIKIVRYNNDGSLDTTFGTNGTVVTPALYYNDYSSYYDSALKLQSDGKILVTGCYLAPSAGIISPGYNMLLARYNADGTVDSEFGTNGIAYGEFLVPASTTRFNSLGKCIEIQSDNKILVGAKVYVGNQDVGIMRFNANGTIDTTFGNNGATIFGNNNFYGDSPRSIKITTDNKIVIGSRRDDNTGSGQPKFFVVTRLSADGIADNTYGTNGSTVITFEILNGLYDMVMNADNQIFLLGYTRTNDFNGITKIGMAKLDSNGNYDSTFGLNGKVTTSLIYNDGVSLDKMILQTDGKLFCSGINGGKYILTRFNGNGSLDTGFASNGILAFNPGFSPSIRSVLAIQNDGKIVFGGAINKNGHIDFGLTRYAFAPLEIHEFESDSFSVVPNPFTDKISLRFNLDASQKLSADLFDSNGRKIQSLINRQSFSVGDNEVQIQMPESLSNGVYFVNVYNGSAHATLKIIK